MIIAIEGINGIGKTTLAERISRLNDSAAFVRLCDPGVSPSHKAYDSIRPLATREDWRHPLTRFALFMAARCELVEEARNLVEKGCVALLDRYLLSCYVYQSEDFNDDMSRLARVVEAFHFPAPDLTLLLTGDPTAAFCRSQTVGVGPDVFESSGVSMLGRLQERYLAYADLGLPGVGRVEIVTVDPDDTVESMFQKSYSFVEQAFKERMRHGASGLR